MNCLGSDDVEPIIVGSNVIEPSEGGSTIRDLLVHPKDRDTILKKSGVIYRYRCGRVDCEEYIGESGRTFG